MLKFKTGSNTDLKQNKISSSSSSYTLTRDVTRRPGTVFWAE